MSWVGKIIAAILMDMLPRFALFLSRLFGLKQSDQRIEERNDEAAKAVEEIIAQPVPETDEAMEERKEKIREAAKNVLG